MESYERVDAHMVATIRPLLLMPFSKYLRAEHTRQAENEIEMMVVLQV